MEKGSRMQYFRALGWENSRVRDHELGSSLSCSQKNKKKNCLGKKIILFMKQVIWFSNMFVFIRILMN